MRRQQGYFLILAVVLVMVIGVMGTIISYTYANRALVSSAEQQGLQAFYIAESGLEVASRLLVGNNTLSCSSLTGASQVTNASVSGGTFTATAVGGALYSASTTLSAAITATSNSMSVVSTTGMAAHGRVRVDSEAIDYAAISGSSLVGLNRGVAGTTAASHALSASVSENICLVDVQAGIPSIASPQYQRELQMAVEILSGTNDIWTVGTRHGNQFTIARWNAPTQNAWNDVSPPSDVSNRRDLYSVSLSSETNGWAVGAPNGNNLTYVQWNGTSWTAAPYSGTGACGQNLNGVSVTSATEGWAVGAQYQTGCNKNGTYNFTLLKWNGTTWTMLTSATSPSIPAAGTSAANPNLNAVDIFDSNNDGKADYGFAVGDSGTILRYTGTSWVASTSGTTNSLKGVYIVSASEAWAVGASGVILKWNGTSWASVSSPTTNQLNSVFMYSSNGTTATAGWAVGNSGTVISYNGTSWSTQTSGTTNNLLAVVAVNASSAFASGLSSTLLQYAGSNWSTLAAPATYANAVDFYGMTYIPGGSVSITGTQVGSWQQTFH